MIRSLEYEIDHDLNTVFDHLALGKDMGKWFSYKEIIEYSNKYDGDRCIGFVIKFKVEDIIGCSENVVTSYEYGNEIRVRETSLRLYDMENHPIHLDTIHKSLVQRIRFFETSGGTLIKHQVYREGGGVIAWLMWHLHFFYAAKKDILRIASDLNDYLNDT